MMAAFVGYLLRAQSIGMQSNFVLLYLMLRYQLRVMRTAQTCILHPEELVSAQNHLGLSRMPSNFGDYICLVSTHEYSVAN